MQFIEQSYTRYDRMSPEERKDGFDSEHFNNEYGQCFRNPK